MNPKNKTRIGNWNVRTMFETGKAGQVAREMKRYKLDFWVLANAGGEEAENPSLIQER